MGIVIPSRRAFDNLFITTYGEKEGDVD